MGLQEELDNSPFSDEEKELLVDSMATFNLIMQKFMAMITDMSITSKEKISTIRAVATALDITEDEVRAAHSSVLTVFDDALARAKEATTEKEETVVQ